MKISPAEIEARLHNELGLDVAIAEAGDGLLVSGTVPTPDDRTVAMDFVRSMAEGAPVVDTVDVASNGRSPLAQAPDFTGSSFTVPVDEVARPLDEMHGLVEGNDPAGLTGEPSGRSGDELAAAIRDAVRLDSLTTGSPIEVEVHGHEVVLTGLVRHQKDVSYVEQLVGDIPGVQSVDARLTIGELPHEPDEHRPGEPAVGTSRLADEAPESGRGQLDQRAREVEGATHVEPTDERGGGGRPYGSDDVTAGYERSGAGSWGEILDWLDHPTGLAEAARAAMVADFTALRDSGEPFPVDGGQLFDAAMRAHTSTRSPEPPPSDWLSPGSSSRSGS